MGMLLLISPPGYGKTTLMEYVASQLGLVFVKVNGPALGHEVTSLDPAEAPNATARQEVEKINLALRDGQQRDALPRRHPAHELRSCCRSSSRSATASASVEGVWKGRTRTYDLRGKKFCVVMAGNPYTESGARFQIPDMLANRADTYNLGDILGGAARTSSRSSYLENALTSNRVLAPLATREPGRRAELVRMARGEDVPLTELAARLLGGGGRGDHVASSKRMIGVQEVLLEVNQQYIASASQEDAYRTEPPFKLQGSYRNMNKLAEKVVAAMNDEELEQLIDDHYASESQTLTTGAEQNLLKLAELRGRMSDEQRARWKEIKESFVRTRRAGGKGDDPVARVTGALGGLDEALQRIQAAIGAAVAANAAAALDAKANAKNGGADESLGPYLAKLEESIRTLGKPSKVELRVDDGTRRGRGVGREHRARAVEDDRARDREPRRAREERARCRQGSVAARRAGPARVTATRKAPAAPPARDHAAGRAREPAARSAGAAGRAIRRAHRGARRGRASSRAPPRDLGGRRLDPSLRRRARRLEPEQLLSRPRR